MWLRNHARTRLNAIVVAVVVVGRRILGWEERSFKEIQGVIVGIGVNRY